MKILEANPIQASKYGIDQTAQFTVETGSMIPVKEDIIGLTFGALNESDLSLGINPTIVQSETVLNNGSETAETELKIEWSFVESSSTSWEENWGITGGLSFDASVKILNIDVDLNFAYSTKTTENIGKTQTRLISRTTKVKIPSGKRVTAHLIVDILDEAVIPFEAKIRRTSEHGTQYFTEKGTWKGVLAFKSHVIIEETDVIITSQSQFLTSGSSFVVSVFETQTVIMFLLIVQMNLKV